MIQIDKNADNKPSILFKRGPRRGLDKLDEATKALKERYLKYEGDIKSGKKKFKFDNSLYGHKVIKTALKNLQHNKCCFCEAKITHIAHGDVEHFRPKAAYKQLSTDDYQYPGYYWLAYDWYNLFFSCQLCNQRHKGNLFPLLDEASRMLDHEGDISNEAATFIHPTHDNPAAFITFEQEVPKARDDSKRGKITIESLGIDRPELNEDRRGQLQTFLDLLNIISLYPNTPEMKPSHDAAKAYLATNIQERMRPEAEYSLMFKALYEQRIQAILEE